MPLNSKELTELSLCYSVVYCCNGSQMYEQFLQVSRLDWALILLDSVLCLLSTYVSLVFVMLYIVNFFVVTFCTLPFSELILEGLTGP